jgi:uncharacterized protein
MATILDSSGVIALLNRKDGSHLACVAVASAEDELIVPPLILAEVDYWCRKYGAHSSYSDFVADMREGVYRLAELEMGDVSRAAELASKYADLDLGVVDASVVALAERLKVERVLTLDRRDFSAVRPRHCAALTLLPA